MQYAWFRSEASSEAKRFLVCDWVNGFNSWGCINYTCHLLTWNFVSLATFDTISGSLQAVLTFVSSRKYVRLRHVGISWAACVQVHAHESVDLSLTCLDSFGVFSSVPVPPGCYSEMATRTISRLTEPSPPNPRGRDTASPKLCTKWESWCYVLYPRRSEERPSMSAGGVSFYGTPCTQDSMRLDQAFRPPFRSPWLQSNLEARLEFPGIRNACFTRDAGVRI